MGKPRITAQVIKVLAVLMSNRNAQTSGSDVGRAAGIRSGTLYPILLRLEEAGWVQSEWEEGNPREMGRPRRRFYRITGTGAKAAREELKEIASVVGRPLWNAS